MRRLARRNVQLQPAHPCIAVESFGWGVGDPWPSARFGILIASDVLYGPHQSCRTCPQELARFVDLLHHALALDGLVILGHVERNCMAREDLRQALQRRFTVRMLRSEDCLNLAVGCPGAGVRGSVVFLCAREESSQLLAAATTAAAGVRGRQSESDVRDALVSDVRDASVCDGRDASAPPPPPTSRSAGDRRDACHMRERLARPLSSPSSDDVSHASRCGMDVRRLCWLEDEIRYGRAPPQVAQAARAQEST